MTRHVVLLDACVLIPYTLCDFLLTCAERELIDVRWSAQILAEVERNLVSTLDMAPEAARRRVGVMERAFPDSIVVGHEPLAPSMPCDRKDRHVLAAAVATGADILVTANLADFPAAPAAALGVTILRPDALVLRLMNEHGDAAVEAVLEAMSRRRTRSPRTVDDLLVALAATIPTAANLIHQWRLADRPSVSPADMPLPLQRVDAREAARAAASQLDDSGLVTAVAMGWLGALAAGGARRRPMMRRLSHRLRAFGDLDELATTLAGYGMASGVWYLVDAPEGDIAVLRLLPCVDEAMQAFAAARVDNGLFMTVVKRADGWRVWGIGPLLLPAHEIRPPRM